MYLKKQLVDCRKKFIISKTNTGPRRKNAWGRQEMTQKLRENNEMLPVAFVWCSKITGVHGIEVCDIRT